jgi:hypothetical protein
VDRAGRRSGSSRVASDCRLRLTARARRGRGRRDARSGHRVRPCAPTKPIVSFVRTSTQATRPMIHKQRATHRSPRGRRFGGDRVLPRKAADLRAAFLGLCPHVPPETSITGWGVVLVSGGRLSYLHHGVVRPSTSDEERAGVLADLVAAYWPVAVARLEREPAAPRSQPEVSGAPVLRYGDGELLRALAPARAQDPCTRQQRASWPWARSPSRRPPRRRWPLSWSRPWITQPVALTAEEPPSSL